MGDVLTQICLQKKALVEKAKINAYDPMIDHWDEVDIDIFSELPDSADYDAIVFSVPHKEFADISFNEWIKHKNILVFDANNVLTKKQVSEIRENKLNYMSIGRG